MEGNLWFDLVKILLTATVTVLVPFIVSYLKQKAGAEKLRSLEFEIYNKQLLAEIAVKFAQQAYEEFDGERRYYEASTFLAREATNYGFALSPDEVEALIKSALKDLKFQFGTEWKKQISSR